MGVKKNRIENAWKSNGAQALCIQRKTAHWPCKHNSHQGKHLRLKTNPGYHPRNTQQRSNSAPTNRRGRFLPSQKQTVHHPSCFTTDLLQLLSPHHHLPHYRSAMNDRTKRNLLLFGSRRTFLPALHQSLSTRTTHYIPHHLTNPAFTTL